MSQKTKISWTDFTWNPYWGCDGGCDYCYARGIANRFGETIARREIESIEKLYNFKISDSVKQAIIRDLKQFRPTFLTHRFYIDFPKKAKRIFVNSMSDPEFWAPDYTNVIMEKISANPEHTFQLLTKFPESLHGFQLPENLIIGITAENQIALRNRLPELLKLNHPKTFISFEPLQGPIEITDDLLKVDWIIIGCQTGRNRIKIDNSIIWNLIYGVKAKKSEIPIFLKQIEIEGAVKKDYWDLPDEFKYREFPDEQRKKAEPFTEEQFIEFCTWLDKK